MKVWIVSRVVPFGVGSHGRQIMGVYARGKDARRIAAGDIFLTAASFKLTKRVKKPPKDLILTVKKNPLTKKAEEMPRGPECGSKTGEA
jgi:hypothetical protein